MKFSPTAIISRVTSAGKRRVAVSAWPQERLEWPRPQRPPSPRRDEKTRSDELCPHLKRELHLEREQEQQLEQQLCQQLCQEQLCPLLIWNQVEPEQLTRTTLSPSRCQSPSRCHCHLLVVVTFSLSLSPSRCHLLVAPSPGGAGVGTRRDRKTCVDTYRRLSIEGRRRRRPQPCRGYPGRANRLTEGWRRSRRHHR